MQYGDTHAAPCISSGKVRLQTEGVCCFIVTGFIGICHCCGHLAVTMNSATALVTSLLWTRLEGIPRTQWDHDSLLKPSHQPVQQCVAEFMVSGTQWDHDSLFKPSKNDLTMSAHLPGSHLPGSWCSMLRQTRHSLCGVGFQRYVGALPSRFQLDLWWLPPF
jgi:hypothetical protein